MDRMLESGESWQLDEWRAYYELEPFGDEWERTSLQTVEIVDTIVAALRAYGGEKEPAEQRPFDYYVPGRAEEHEQARVDEQLAAVDSIEGL